MSLTTKLEPTQKIADDLRKLPYKRAWLCYIFPIAAFSGDQAYCALGGLARNYGMSNKRILLNPSSIKSHLKKHMNITDEESEQFYNCPHCNEHKKLFGMLPHLNDTHFMNWSKMAETFDVLHCYKREPQTPLYKVILEKINNKFFD
ncbi:MAG: hypothetical protein GTO02_10530 [Candidatus Dadabacteria bacterium]|nr:hypothetical protein [Candidatus Dadabacteria bacterium]